MRQAHFRAMNDFLTDRTREPNQRGVEPRASDGEAAIRPAQSRDAQSRNAEGEQTSIEATVRFRAVFEGEFTYVWNALRRLGVRPSDLEDVTHEVFIRVYRRFDDFDASRALRPWLFGFAYRGAADYRRLARHRHEVSSEISNDASDPTLSAEDQLVERDNRAILDRALDSVPLERRAILVLHELEGRAIPEIAEALGLPVNTAYSRLRIARGELSQAIGRIRAQKREAP
jgi:RNA polymerase sigma-70 factor, ECF subfamily